MAYNRPTKGDPDGEDNTLTTEFESAAHVSFRPSWIDRLVLWIDKLPGAGWFLYVLGVVGAAVLINAVLWIDGSVPLGSYGAIRGIFPPFVFYFLALYHYLTRVGSRSLMVFRPLMGVEDAGYARAHRELTMLPGSLGWLAIAAALASTPIYFLSGQVFGDLVPETPLPFITAFLLAAFFQATFFCLLIRSLRQLRMVHRLHAESSNINLLKLRPAHALSGLTARTGIGLILLFVLGYFYLPSLFSGNWLVASYLTFAGPAVAAFIVPLIAMRDRIQAEKWRLLDEAADLLQMASDEMESRIQARDFEGVHGMESTIRALISRRDMLENVSTWPWDPATLRGFASALLLPLFIWLATRLLDRFF